MKQVLLLEDDVDLRRAICHLIGGPHVQLLEAGSIAEAERLLKDYHPHLLIVDGLLEDGLGLDFIERFRRRDRRTPVVFMSAFAKDLRDLHRLTQQLDIALIYYKPIEPAEFAQKVDDLLDLYDTASLQAAKPEASQEPDLDALREAFGQRLASKLEELQRAVEQARTDAQALKHACNLAHRLRGSAGSYGFTEAGEVAGSVEDALRQVEQTRADPSDAVWRSLIEKLRCARQKPSAAAETSLEVAPEAPPAPKAPLLVVDDDEEFLQFVTATAQTLHAEVLTARTSQAALKIARSQPIAAGLLDVHLEDGESSFELARALRKTRGNSDIPVGFISADRTIATRVEAMEAGAARFVEKPLPQQQLVDALSKLLRARQKDRGRVLIVDDDPEAHDLYAQHLIARGYTIEHLRSAEHLIETLEQRPPDALLLDADIPHVSGFDVCRALRMSEHWELLSVLLLTSRSDSATRLRAFRAGASDVVVKPVLTHELIARLDVQCQLARLTRQRADTDALSGLLLRRAFMNAAHAALSRCHRETTALSLTLIDIDHFKAINDTHGHLAGDQVLAQLGTLLQRRFRSEDLKARWGGEELVLLFPGQDMEVARQATQRLKDDVRDMTFTSDEGVPFSVTFTAGVASYPRDGENINALLRCADERLYQGKRQGRDQVIAAPIAASESPT